VLLGTVTPLPAPMFSGARVWLQTTVSDTTLAPRRALVSVPYSIHAQNADVALALSAGDITGTVQLTCGSIAGVVVYIPGRSFVCFTGASGTFDLSSVPPGTYTVHLEASNPTRTTDVANVVVTAGGVTNLGTVSLGGPNLATDPANCGA